MGKVGDTKGNCDYTKQCLAAELFSVHSLGSISLQQLTLSSFICPCQHRNNI